MLRQVDGLISQRRNTNEGQSTTNYQKAKEKSHAIRRIY